MKEIILDAYALERLGEYGMTLAKLMRVIRCKHSTAKRIAEDAGVLDVFIANGKDAMRTSARTKPKRRT